MSSMAKRMHLLKSNFEEKKEMLQLRGVLAKEITNLTGE